MECKVFLMCLMIYIVVHMTKNRCHPCGFSPTAEQSIFFRVWLFLSVTELDWVLYFTVFAFWMSNNLLMCLNKSLWNFWVPSLEDSKNEQRIVYVISLSTWLSRIFFHCIKFTVFGKCISDNHNWIVAYLSCRYIHYV